MDSKLLAAYRFHRTHNAARTSRYERQSERARGALILAREDVAKGVKRYADRGAYAKPPYGEATRQPAPDANSAAARRGEVLVYLHHGSALGLRHVGNVEAESYGGRDCWANRDSCGWYTDPNGDTFKDGTGLCWGVVYQLAGRKGESRFVAGYQMGGCSEGPTLDFGRVYVEPREDPGYWTDSPRAMDAARNAAYAADGMAQRAAEEEREYQAAWQAGSRWADLGEEISDYRKEALRLLREFKAARAKADRFSYPALCAGIRQHIRDQIDAISEAREARERLKGGDAPGGMTFYPDERLRAAFNEGAGGKVI